MSTPLPTKLLTEMTDEDLKGIARALMAEHKGVSNTTALIRFVVKRDRRSNILSVSVVYDVYPSIY